MSQTYRVGQKVSCCISARNFVNYGPIKVILLLENLLHIQKDVFY